MTHNRKNLFIFHPVLFFYIFLHDFPKQLGTKLIRTYNIVTVYLTIYIKEIEYFSIQKAHYDFCVFCCEKKKEIFKCFINK